MPTQEQNTAESSSNSEQSAVKPGFTGRHMDDQKGSLGNSDEEHLAGDNNAAGKNNESMDADDVFEMPKIGGYDSASKPFLKEPTFYLSLAVVLIGMSLTLSDKPIVFGVAFGIMFAIAVALHILAERFLFSKKSENKTLRAPGEGLFVLTFGSILPGVSLLAYAVYVLCTSQQSNYAIAAGKIMLLLTVPIFNFVVWKTLRKGYLPRPRITGLMNGVAAGLSASWTMIWLKSLCDAQLASQCKFGWMLLLFMSPLMLLAAVCLAIDLLKKTEPRISLITSIFGLLGCLFALSFVLAPIGHSLFIQSCILDARSGSLSLQKKAIATLRKVAKKEDLNPSAYPLGDLGLAELLIPNRGLNARVEGDKNLFFRITGLPFENQKNNGFYEDKWNSDANFATSVVGSKIPGLSLRRSQISGSLDSTSLSGSIDWTMIFRNSGVREQEARAEILIPAGSVVSGVTLWVNDRPLEGAFAPMPIARGAYQQEIIRMKDPLLVTMSGRDRMFVQCYPVAANGGEMKIRLGIKVPLSVNDKNCCSVRLPRLLDTNFVNPRRHRIHLQSNDQIDSKLGTCVVNSQRGFTLNTILRNNAEESDIDLLRIHRTSKATEISVVDCYSKGKRFITEKIQEVSAFSPKHLLVVLDSSESVKEELEQIRTAFSTIPLSMNQKLFFVNEDADNQEELKPKNLKYGLQILSPKSFIGGRNNNTELREALDTASERADSAVLWIHGPQPLNENSANNSELDLINNVYLYDFEIQPGPNALLQALYMESCGSLINYFPVTRSGSVASDLEALFATWKNPPTETVVMRSISEKPPSDLLSDPTVSSQLTCLWAKNEVELLIAKGMRKPAERLGSNYRLITPASAAVVFATKNDFAAHKLDPGNFNNAPESINETHRGMTKWFKDDIVGNLFGNLTQLAFKWLSEMLHGIGGTPVDPRYAQSNEVGQLADYGYDTARDISRGVTMLSFIVSIIFGLRIASNKRNKTSRGIAIAKGICFAFLLPTMVHLIGTFFINNLGGIGGAL